uniref:acyltransferase-like protein At1g54570, chloroplastic n=1 Tax=Erigeron canadensis TaxID=72917 RepID=UPI001CB8D395|nr:acyltransferase-like protein At1g54570, chloroplastic [Erigeron canadensis]
MSLIPSNSGSVPLPPLFTLKDNHRIRKRVPLRSTVGGENSGKESWESPVRISCASSIDRKGVNAGSYDIRGKTSEKYFSDQIELENLWDDGYGTQTLKDYLEVAKDLIKSDGGPPRWFCSVSCGQPLKDSPILLFLPGVDGTGAGLVVHEKSLGKAFHVQCLHIPVSDRTPFEGLIKIVEETVMIEYTLSPNKPIYLLGESFGGTLALVVAARNPNIDLILVLANPATSFDRSMMHPFSSFLRALPDEHYWMFTSAIKPILGNYIKMAMVKIYDISLSAFLWQLPGNLSKYLPLLSVVAKIYPKETLTWRLKLVESAAAYANSRLHAIRAQVLVLASGNDKLMPSKNEAWRLSRLLKRCNVRVFEGNGHTILLESGVNVLYFIKANEIYRRFSKYDVIKDFFPVSITELKTSLVETWWYNLYIDAVMFSTMEDGKVVRGLAGIPDEGPVLIVGNHMLLAFDICPLVAEFVREKKIMLHGLTHPDLFRGNAALESLAIPFTDLIKIAGSTPVSGRNLFRLLAKKSHVLLYPGGIREGLHRKGEAGKLFWPEKQEFVRMAVKFGATIIPFGGVGEDDIAELIIDYNDMKRIPFLDQKVNELNQGKKNLREGMGGEIANQPFHLPIFLPKIPGRLYFMFGKPILTKGKEKMSNDEDYLQELYSQIRYDVENNIAYLLKMREQDPYRGNVERIIWKIFHYGNSHKVPSFEP